MFYVVAILIAGLWAAFLLPSFFDHRSRAPKTTTRDFARTRRLLEQVTTSDPDGEDYVRHHAQVRRQRILIALLLTAFISLGVATWMGSIAWLWLTVGLDVAVAMYVTGLLYMKQQRSLPRAAVVPIGAAPHAQVSKANAEKPPFEETPTVRVIAG
jgi:hypothetical protein